MRIADEDTHAVLSYIAALTKQGCAPTWSQVEQYAANPRRSAPGLVTIRNVIAPRQALVEYARQVGWLSQAGDDPDKASLTDLGRAALGALDEQQANAEHTPAIVLDAKDPVAYARLVREISGSGACMLADPYFRIDSLGDVIEHTSCSRVLTSKRIQGADVEALKVALKRLPAERRLEIRVSASDDFHDRFIVPDQGPVSFVGSSVNSVGKKLSVIGKINEPAARQIRNAYNEFWKQGEPLIPQP